MWIVSGPRSIVPLCGEGIEARRVTPSGFCRRREPPVRVSGPVEGVWGNREVPPAGHAGYEACWLEQDLEGHVGGAAPLEQVRRDVQIDVEPDGALGGRGRSVARPFERLGPPRLTP